MEYIFGKDHFEGQVIKNEVTNEVFFVIWSRKFPLEMVTKTLEDGSEILAYKIKFTDAPILQTFFTKLSMAPEKRIFKFKPEKAKPESLFSKIKRKLFNV